jgi:hypothetical protein
MLIVGHVLIVSEYLKLVSRVNTCVDYYSEINKNKQELNSSETRCN